MLRVGLLFVCLFGSVAGTASEEEVCLKLLNAVQSSSAFSKRQLEIFERYPNCPYIRAYLLANEFGDLASPILYVPSANVLVSRSRGLRWSLTERSAAKLVARANKQGFSGVRVAHLGENFNTVFFAGPHDISFQKKDLLVVSGEGITVELPLFVPRAYSKALVTWMAGLTGIPSNAGRVLNQVSRMNEWKGKGTIPEEVNRWGVFVPLSAIAFDVPFHGSGPLGQKFRSAQGMTDFLTDIYLKLASHNRPIIAGSRSGNSLYLGMANAHFAKTLVKKNPIKGMIWMAPMLPENGYVETIENYHQRHIIQNPSHLPQLNPAAIRWFLDLNKEIRKNSRWWEKGMLGDPPTPTLFLVGEKDPEVPKSTRNALKALATKYPNEAFYMEIPGADHDVYAVTEGILGGGREVTPEALKRAAIAWAYTYWFIHGRVLGEPVKLPDYGYLYQPGS